MLKSESVSMKYTFLPMRSLTGRMSSETKKPVTLTTNGMITMYCLNTHKNSSK